MNDTKQPDVEAIAREAARLITIHNHGPDFNREIIAAAIRRALEPFQQANKQHCAEWMRLRDFIVGESPSELFRFSDACKKASGVHAFQAYLSQLWNTVADAKSERDAAVNGMLDLKRTNQMLAEQLADAIEVLKAVEWHGERVGYKACPYCYVEYLNPHLDDCKLAKAIATNENSHLCAVTSPHE